MPDPMRWFLAGADAVDPRHRRWYSLAAYAVVLGAVFHVGFVALFALLDIGQLAWLNVGSVAIFVVVGAVHRTGRMGTAFGLAAAEVFGSAIANVVTVGWDAGLQLYVVVPLLWNAISPLRLPGRVVLWSTGIATYLGLYAWAERHAPLAPLPSSVTQGLYVANSVGTFACLLLLAYVLDSAATRLQSAVERERRRADLLLENMLPGSIVTRLKRDLGTIADSFPHASVLFCDIVGFTSHSERVTPEALVSVLNELFSRFDEVVERHRVEKIKTIGDAYMVAAGIPEPRADHAEVLAELALELPRLVSEVGAAHGADLRMRIGIHSGPVVAGVIGKKKYTYDLWGDTVNTAARMESHGIAGEIQVTESTFQLIRHGFELTERGTIDVKGKGPMRTFLLRGKRAADREVDPPGLDAATTRGSHPRSGPTAG